VAYDSDGEADANQPELERQCCAGALILAEKIGVQNRIMQIGQRLGFFDPARLSGHNEVWDTKAEFIEAQYASERLDQG
jgi:hypothetical protein